MPDLWLVALASTAAALAAVLGVIPVLIAGEASPRLGWANALASGIMLGAGYILLRHGIALHPGTAVAGAAIGVGLVWASHWLTHMERVDLSRPDGRRSASTGQTVRREGIHSAAEGVAIGMSFVVDPLLGFLMAGTFALHNAAEGATISAALMARGWKPLGAASLAALSMLTHVPAALAVVAWVPTAGRSWALGFSAGSMLYLVFVELIPESYRQRGHTGIAIAASAAMSIVVLLGALLTDG